MQCRPTVISFPINDSFVFAVNRDENKQYYISGCGNYYLQTSYVDEKDPLIEHGKNIKNCSLDAAQRNQGFH